MNFPIEIKRPVIFFDLETTGLDQKYDRIIEIGAVKIYPDGKREVLTMKINPLMRISAEISALTGISNEEVEKAPTFAQAAPEIASFFEGCDLGGYNIARFDVKVMTEEFKRAGMNFDADNRAVIDSQVIFHQKEKRDLSAAYKFYCHRELSGAHSAQADVNATVDIFIAQMERYTDLPRNLNELHRFCRGNQDRFVDSEGKFFWRDGEAVFNFGKFKSQTLRSVAQKNPEYLHWVLSPERQFSQDVIDICYRAMKGEFPAKKVES
ncbi:MAG: DNA polymerase III PolC-type [Elusimicrobia bacterium]|nr:DNA polymerase III PolC-type [Elusimicrobiota bacterium]